MSDNEIYLLIKYIKSVRRRVAKRLSYIEDARCLKVKARWLLYVPPGLTLKNSAYCPHSISLLFVWISEQTVTMQYYSTDLHNRDAQCLLCGAKRMF